MARAVVSTVTSAGGEQLNSSWKPPGGNENVDMQMRDSQLVPPVFLGLCAVVHDGWMTTPSQIAVVSEIVLHGFEKLVRVTW
jgi:hypothetical protein